MTSGEPTRPESPVYEVGISDGGLSWNAVPIACATCGASTSLRLRVRYRTARVDPTAHIVCPEGHETSDHPLVYPDMVLTLFNWAKTEEPRPPLQEALANWGPHRTTWIDPVPDEPDDQRTVFYGRWVHASDLQENRDQWPTLVATVARLWAEHAAHEPSMTPWRAAWLYAEMLTDQFSRSTPHRTDQVRALIARAITIQAGLDGLNLVLADGQLAEVRALAPVSLKDILIERLDRFQVVVEFLKPELGSLPTADETGYEAYGRLYKLLAYGAEILGDEALDRQGQRDTRVFASHANAAFQVITGAITDTASVYDDDITLGRLNKQLSQHLARRQ